VGNVEVILSLYDRVAKGEQPGDLFHADVEWSMPHPGGDAHGIAEVGAFWRDYEAIWESREIDLEDVRELAGFKAWLDRAEALRAAGLGA